MDKRFIFIILGVIIAAELIWAGWTLSKEWTQSKIAPAPSPVIRPQRTKVVKPTTISLVADKNQLKKGEKLTVAINISSEIATDGTDLIILYDPKLLSVNAQTPVTLGSLYDDFPLNKVDSESGRITISGISNKSGGTVANGLFGTVIFTAKKAGVAKISLDFTAGSTVDSNVIETDSGKDVLEKVNNLEVNIQ